MFCFFVRVNYDSVVPLGWVQILNFNWVGLGQPVYGLGHKKWTHGQLYVGYNYMTSISNL